MEYIKKLFALLYPILKAKTYTEAEEDLKKLYTLCFNKDKFSRYLWAIVYAHAFEKRKEDPDETPYVDELLRGLYKRTPDAVAGNSEAAWGELISYANSMCDPSEGGAYAPYMSKFYMDLCSIYMDVVETEWKLGKQTA